MSNNRICGSSQGFLCQCSS